MAQPVSPVLKDGIRHPNEQLFDLGGDNLPIPALVLQPSEPDGRALAITRWKFTPMEVEAIVKTNGEFYIAFCSGIMPALKVFGIEPKLTPHEGGNGIIDFNIPDDDSLLVGSLEITGIGENQSERGRIPKPGTHEGDDGDRG